MIMAVALQSSSSINSFSGHGGAINDTSNNGLAPHLGGKKLDLEMIYEAQEDMIDDSSGGQSDQNPPPASPRNRAMLMMKRSRSLPHEEFVYLSQKLKELDLIRRTDSVISGQSARYITSTFILTLSRYFGQENLKSFLFKN